MPYPAQFHRLVMIGTLYSDIFNVTLSLVPRSAGGVPAVTDEWAQEIGDIVSLWWNDALSAGAPHGIGITNAAVLRSIKLNRIGTDGRYVDSETREYLLPEPFPGQSANTPPAQLSVAATLRGDNPRGLAGKGRMFFPPNHFSGSVGADGRITDVQATQYAQGVGSLLEQLNAYTAAAGTNTVAGIASNTRAGAFQPVQSVTVGRTIDTIRSRRNKIAEDFVVEELGA